MERHAARYPSGSGFGSSKLNVLHSLCVSRQPIGSGSGSKCAPSGSGSASTSGSGSGLGGTPSDRAKIGVSFGNPETTTGGNALKFYSSVRLDIRRIGAVKKGDEILGNQTRVKVVKNKVAPPFQKCEFDILYNEGISKEGELIDMGVEHKLVEKSGAWYSYNSERIGQGRDNVREFLREHPDMASEIENLVRQKMGLNEVGNRLEAGADPVVEPEREPETEEA